MAKSRDTRQWISVNTGDPLYDGWGWWFSKTKFRDDRVMLYVTYLPEVYERSAGSLITMLPTSAANDPLNIN